MKVEVIEERKRWSKGTILVNKTFRNIVIFLENHEHKDRFIGMEIDSPVPNNINHLVPDTVWSRDSFEFFRGVVTLSNN
jgi:hypothetical protein